MDGELAPGVYGGEKGLEAWLSFHDVDSIEEIGRDLQLTLLEDDHDRDPTDPPAWRRAA